MNTDQIIEYAADTHKELKNTDPLLFDWRGPLRTLVQSGVFTVPQAALVLNINKQYAQRYMTEISGKVKDEGRRSRSGVSGKFNPSSLDKIKLLRTLWANKARESNGRKYINETERGLLKSILDDGNGVRLVHHLTDIPVGTVNRTKKEAV